MKGNRSRRSDRLGADFPTVQAAIDGVPAAIRERNLIEIRPGNYSGHTVLDKPHVTLRGSGPSTLLTYDLIVRRCMMEDGHGGVVLGRWCGMCACRTSPVLTARECGTSGDSSAVIDGIRLSDSTFCGLLNSDVVEHADSIKMKRLTLEPEKR